MVEMASIVQYLNTLPSIEPLYKEPIFALGLLKLMNDDITLLIFSLTTASIHISRLRHISNIKESLSTLIQIRLVSKNDNVVSLNESFRASLLRGFCFSSTYICYEVVCNAPHQIKNQSKENERILIDESKAARPTGIADDARKNSRGSQTCDMALDEQASYCADNVLSSLTEVDDESLKKIIKAASNYKFQSLLQAVVNKSTDLFFSIKDILLFCNLSDSFNQITSQGFEFLLKNRSDQHWSIIMNSIKYFSRDPDEELKMLACLMEMVVKRKITIYRTRKWSKWLLFLDSIGILHVITFGGAHKGKSTLVTSIKRLGASPCVLEYVGRIVSEVERLSQKADGFTYFYINNHDLFTIRDAAESQSSKFIILETNYKIYAYTNKSYEKSILNLFSKAVYTLPNLVKARLDEESMCRAFSKGIMAKQILKYLGEFSEDVPSSVANQIIIWENKQHRIKDNNAILYSDFLHLSDYLGVLRFLEEKHAVLLKDEAKRIIVGTENTYDITKEFIRTL